VVYEIAVISRMRSLNISANAVFGYYWPQDRKLGIEQLVVYVLQNLTRGRILQEEKTERYRHER
jgi:hypothetical protein